MSSASFVAGGAKGSPVPEGTAVTLMLPWVEGWVREEMVFAVFRDLNWGWISKVDMVSVEKGKRPHQKVFIHFSEWHESAADMLEHLSAEPIREVTTKGHRAVYPEAKVYYNDTFYWKVRKSAWKQKPMAPATPKRKVEIVPLKRVVQPPSSFGDVALSESGEMVARSTPVERQGAQSPVDIYSPQSPAYTPQSPVLGKATPVAAGDPDGVEVL
jgi:hypothetical protein